MSVTAVETLIRDPFAIYARHILRLKALRPLRPEADALLRGTVLHQVFADFMADWVAGGVADPKAHLTQIARAEISRSVEWPLAARLFEARIDRIAVQFIDEEIIHLDTHRLLAVEVKGETTFDSVGFTLHARADRIDRKRSGGLVVLDYKSGATPSVNQMERFRVQLLLEALIAEAGGFENIPCERVEEVRYLALNGEARPKAVPLRDDGKLDFTTASIRTRFEGLVRSYDRRERGFTARRAVERTEHAGDYDHLARYGEWDDTDRPFPEDVG